MLQYVLVASFLFASLVNEALQVPQKFRKSDLFLSQSAIAGVPGIGIAPEDVIPPVGGQQPLSNLPLGVQQSVLEGNYPHSSMEIPAREEYERRLQNKGKKRKQPSGPNVGGRRGEEPYMRPINRPIIDPIRKIISDSATFDQSPETMGEGQPKTGGPTINPSPEATNTNQSIFDEDVIDPALLRGGQEAFANKVIECKDKMALCSAGKSEVLKCYLHCLLGTHPVGKPALGSIMSFVKSLCNPIGTVFDLNVPVFEKNADKVLTPNNFLTLFKVGTDSIKRFSHMAINSAPTILMKYSQSLDTVLLKKMMNGLESAIRNAGSGFTEQTDELVNPSCPFIHPVDTVSDLINLFYKSPKSFDILLMGSWTVTKMFQMIPEHHLHVLIEGFGGALKTIAGLEAGCGMLVKGQAGEQEECNEEEIIQWDKEKFVPADNGDQVVCGSMPYFSQNLIDEIFPSIFLPDETTTTSTVAPNPEIGGRIGLGGVGKKLTGDLVNLIDTILNANLDYDDDDE